MDFRNAKSTDPAANGSTAAARAMIAERLADLPVIEGVVFAAERDHCPELAYQVPFPRVGLVLSGELDHVIGAPAGRTEQVSQTTSVALFVPADGWHDPQWRGEDVTTLDLLFGKQRLGFALARWNGHEQLSIAKYDVPRRGPRIGTFILQALGETALHRDDRVTPVHLIRALIAHARDLMNIQVPAASRSAAFFQAIRDYVEQNYSAKLSRESVADAFDITPNYLSHLFKKEIGISFNDHVNMVRLEQAKHLLRQYDMSIKEVATRCGFADSNYFCRLFRQRTDRSPSEYRVHYHSRSLSE